MKYGHDRESIAYELSRDKSIILILQGMSNMGQFYYSSDTIHHLELWDESYLMFFDKARQKII